MSAAAHRLALSIDLDEWYHSRRRVDGEQAAVVPDTTALFRRLYGRDRPIGEVVGPTHDLLALLERYNCRCTFFVLGEVFQGRIVTPSEAASRVLDAAGAERRVA